MRRSGDDCGRVGDLDNVILIRSWGDERMKYNTQHPC